MSNRALDEAIIFGHELEFVDEATAKEMIGAKLAEIGRRINGEVQD